MAYSKHFQLVDDVAAHFDIVVNSADAFLQSRYVGFYAVAAAAVLELALKEIVVEFARHHHALFGDYMASSYEQVRGQIRIAHITGKHLKPFGGKFQDRFRDLLKEMDQLSICESGYSVNLSYEALLTCRHKFAHEGSVPATTSYADIKNGFSAGKVVMECLAKTLEPS
jgi:hypothetical protein